MIKTVSGTDSLDRSFLLQDRENSEPLGYLNPDSVTVIMTVTSGSLADLIKTRASLELTLLLIINWHYTAS